MLLARDTQPPDPAAPLIGEILALVEDRRGLPLALYRRGMVERRIAHRMRRSGSPDLPAYLTRLRRDERELDALVESVCIKVSRFFRDQAVFAWIAGRIRQAVEAGRRPRIWSAGCGQGEEPYSLAALLEAAGAPPDVQVLATDTDPTALEATAAARYPFARLQEIPAEHRRWFLPSGDGTFRPDPRLRDRISLERLELGSGAPPRERSFDLVLCRNVLIYFTGPLQRRVEALLSRALAPGGILCLGEAEWCSRPEEFGLEPLDRRLRLLGSPPVGTPGRVDAPAS